MYFKIYRHTIQCVCNIKCDATFSTVPLTSNVKKKNKTHKGTHTDCINRCIHLHCLAQTISVCVCSYNKHTVHIGMLCTPTTAAAATTIQMAAANDRKCAFNGMPQPLLSVCMAWLPPIQCDIRQFFHHGVLSLGILNHI